MGHNISPAPHSNHAQQADVSANRPYAPQQKIPDLQHGAPAHGLDPKRYYKGSSPERPIELDIPIDDARVGGTTSVSLNGKTVTVRYPAWVRHKEPMHFYSSDGSPVCVKMKIKTLASNVAMTIWGLAILLILLIGILNIPAVDAWLARSSIDTDFEWFVMGVIPCLVLVHYLFLYRYRSECRAHRPLPKDKKK